MPIFLEEIVIEGDDNIDEIEGLFECVLLKYGLSFRGYGLKRIATGNYKFTSDESGYYFTSGTLKEGDLVLIKHQGNYHDERKYLVKERRWKKLVPDSKRNRAPQDVENEQYIPIDCDIRYSYSEIEWIRVGLRPIEMDDKIIIFTKEFRIYIVSSWSGSIVFLAEYKKISDNEFVVFKLFSAKRAVDFGKEDHISRFRQEISFHMDRLKYIERSRKQYCSKHNI